MRNRASSLALHALLAPCGEKPPPFLPPVVPPPRGEKPPRSASLAERAPAPRARPTCQHRPEDSPPPPSRCLSVCLSVCPSVCLSVCLSLPWLSLALSRAHGGKPNLHRARRKCWPTRRGRSRRACGACDACAGCGAGWPRGRRRSCNGSCSSSAGTFRRF